MNFAYYLLEKGASDQIALITEKEQIRYDDLRDAVNQMTYQLMQAGVRAGDRVCLLSANSPFWVTAYLATISIGAVAVPLPLSIQPEELAYVLQLTGCRVVCLQKRARRFIPDSLTHDLTFIVEDQYLLDEVVEVPIHPIDKPTTEAVLIFTSGTTSRPKLVQLSHQNLIANTESIISYLDLSSNERIMVAMPFYYCFGLSLLHTHLRAGGTAVLNNHFAFPEKVLNMMEVTECTGFAGVPSMYHTLLRNSTFVRRELPTLKKVQQAGGYLSTVLISELIEALPQAEIFIMYGQTEATARLSYLPPHLLPEKLGSIGKGIPGVELQVVDSCGNPVAVGETGEIVARGANIALGYLGNLEATSQKFIAGALQTGDLATVDEDGFIYIVDRESDILKPNGMRVSSHKIESVVMQLPEVVQTAVIGVPDAERGEAVRVYAVLAPDAYLGEQAIIAHCRQQMARPVAPTQVRFVDQLPLNSNGKVLHAKLREMARYELLNAEKVMVA